MRSTLSPPGALRLRGHVQTRARMLGKEYPVEYTKWAEGEMEGFLVRVANDGLIRLPFALRVWRLVNRSKRYLQRHRDDLHVRLRARTYLNGKDVDFRHGETLVVWLENV